MPATATTLAALRALIAPMSGEAPTAAVGGIAARTAATGNTARTVATGIAALDRELGGGFVRGAIHDLVPAPHRSGGRRGGTGTGAAGPDGTGPGGTDPSGTDPSGLASGEPEPGAAEPGAVGPGPAGPREAGSGGDAAGGAPVAATGIWGGASAAAWSTATGFALALAARAAGRRGEVLWIADERAAAEWGEIYAPGLAAFGVDPARFLLARARRGEHVLRIMEDALRSPALAVVGEIGHDRATTLSASRRLALAARDGGFGLLLRPPGGEPSAAATRWRIAPAAGLPPDAAEDDLGGLGRAALRLELLRNRSGRSGGSWLVGWNSDEHIFFEAASRGLARPLRHGPPGADVAAAA